jgi:ClpP class serine protease
MVTNVILDVILILLLLQFFSPMIFKWVQDNRRFSALRALERERKSRVITLIHRQEAMLFFGIPLARYIDIEDSERILRAIRLTPPDMPVDLIMHTPGDLCWLQSRSRLL